MSKTRTEWSILHAGEVHVFQDEEAAKSFIVGILQMVAIEVAQSLEGPLKAHIITIGKFQIIPRVYHEP